MTTARSMTVVVTSLLLAWCCCSLLVSAADDVVVKLRNDSGELVSLHWVDPKTKQATLLSQIPLNKTLTLNSFYRHEFQIHQEPNEETGLCGVTESSDSSEGAGGGECKVNYFAVEHRHEQCKSAY